MTRTDADWTLAVTGIAGPDGGTQEKPVGLVYISLAKKTPDGKAEIIDVKEMKFTGDRTHIRSRVAVTALDMLRRALLHLPN